MSYVKEWEQAKKDFKKRVMAELKKGLDKIPADFIISVSEFLKADTGMTPALKDVDSAFDKKHRKAVMKALTEVHGVIEKVAMQVQKIALSAGSKSADATDKTAKAALDEIQMAGLDFKRTLTGFETSIAKELEKLQEEKSADGKKIDIISLEGDMNGAIDKFKKDTKAFADTEKKVKTLDATKAAVKAMQAYSKAAARTEVANAITHLQAFFDAVDDLVDHGKKVPNQKPKPDDDYIKAVNSLCDALKGIKTARGAVSMKNLKSLSAAG